MTKKKYDQFNMNTAMSRARLTKCIELMRAMGTGTAAELADRMELKKSTIVRYVAHLYAEDVFRVVCPPDSTAPAIYALSPAHAQATASEGDTYPVIQRTVGANDWPRGQHAHRMGLLAALYPITPAQA